MRIRRRSAKKGRVSARLMISAGRIPFPSNRFPVDHHVVKIIGQDGANLIGGCQALHGLAGYLADALAGSGTSRNTRPLPLRAAP